MKVATLAWFVWGALVLAFLQGPKDAANGRLVESDGPSGSDESQEHGDHQHRDGTRDRIRSNDSPSSSGRPHSIDQPPLDAGYHDGPSGDETACITFRGASAGPYATLWVAICFAAWVTLLILGRLRVFDYRPTSIRMYYTFAAQTLAPLVVYLVSWATSGWWVTDAICTTARVVLLWAVVYVKTVFSGTLRGRSAAYAMVWTVGLIGGARSATEEMAAAWFLRALVECAATMHLSVLMGPAINTLGSASTTACLHTLEFVVALQLIKQFGYPYGASMAFSLALLIAEERWYLLSDMFGPFVDRQVAVLKGWIYGAEPPVPRGRMKRSMPRCQRTTMPLSGSSSSAAPSSSSFSSSFSFPTRSTSTQENLTACHASESASVLFKSE